MDRPSSALRALRDPGLDWNERGAFTRPRVARPCPGGSAPRPRVSVALGMPPLSGQTRRLGQVLNLGQPQAPLATTSVQFSLLPGTLLAAGAPSPTPTPFCTRELDMQRRTGMRFCTLWRPAACPAHLAVGTEDPPCWRCEAGRTPRSR